MFTPNMSTIDRIGRILLGIALLICYTVFSPARGSEFFLLGLLPMATGLVGYCPLYSLLKLNTRKTE